MGWDWMVGITGYSFIDYWFLIHVCFWVVVGSTIASLRLPRVFAVFQSLTVACLWEMFERVAEKQWPQIWESPESWWNSLGSDLLTVVIGMLIAYYGFDKWRNVNQVKG